MASGRPDWYSSVAMHGKHNNDYITLAVDNLGYMLAKMTGLFGATYKTIAVDTDGVMKANLSAQDLKPLRVMPFYGGADRYGTSFAVVTNTDTQLKLIEATGIILGGFWYWSDAVSAKTGNPSLYVDGEVIAIQTIEGLNTKGIDTPESYPIFVTQYDDAGFKYTVCLTKGIPFESSMAMNFYHTQGHNISVTIELVWAELG